MLTFVIPAMWLAGAVHALESDGVAVASAARPADWRTLGVGRLLPDVQGTTLDGTNWRLADERDQKAIVLAMTSATCPLSRKYAPTLARLENEWAGRGVRFAFINSSAIESTDDMREHARASGFEGPYLHDADQRLAGVLHSRTTGEVIVLDAAHTIVYRGAVDDQYGLNFAIESPRANYLVDALAATLSGETPAVRATTAPGCVIDPPAALDPAAVADEATSDITWHNRISRIVQNNCMECHRAGGIAPFPLEDYDDVASRAGMIRYVVGDGIMPPWFAAPKQNVTESPWRNDRSLTAEDKADLLAWLDGARAEGHPTDAPLPRAFASSWRIGEPDAILQLPEPQQVKAEGVMPYVHVRVDTCFDDDRWVQAIEVQPTARAVVHHVLVFAVPKSDAGRAGGRIREAIDETNGFFAAYVPGGGFAIYPEGFAKLLPKNSTLIFQLHYTPNGAATTDQTRIGLRFAGTPPEHVVRVAGIANRRLNIPANDPNHEEQASVPVPFDARLLAFMPHMHVRGKAFHYEATLPDGTTSTLLDVPHYDFNWQLRYELREPIELPAGSTITATGWYDNSRSNPANPDPDKNVRWGPQTYDEMMLGYVEYYIPAREGQSEAEAALKGASGLEGDRFDRLLRMFDRDGNGQIERAEVPDRLQRQFDGLDRNKDGVVSRDEPQ